MTAPTIDAMLTKWVADGELPDIPGGWTIPRLVVHVRREALREAREAVAAVALYDEADQIVTMRGDLRPVTTLADAAQAVRTRSVAAIDALMGGSPK